MLNSQSNPKEEGLNPAIYESVTMPEKLQIEAMHPQEEIEDKERPKKNEISFFRQFVCCSCFATARGNHKYKLNTSDNNDTITSSPSDVNGKKKKSHASKEARLKGLEKSKDKEKENNDSLCLMPPQDLSASNGTSSCFNKLNDDDSQDSDNNSKTIKYHSENEKLLPEISERNQNKKCFIIDLDETLVHSSFKFVKTADINVNVDIDGIQHEVYVCKRPHVDEFLAQLGDLFECVLFTASLGKYADPVTDFLDSNGIFQARLFREACAFKEGNYVKDLDSVGRELDSIVILDNSPVSYLLHPRNALQIVSWFDDPSDTALRDLIPYFKDLAASPLSVPEWLQRNKPPESAGILGHPPSNLHWILMQTLSVPEAVSIYQQRLRESYHASGSSNVSRQSSTRGGTESHEPHVAHHGLITQAIKANRRKSLAAQEDDNNRPPVSSPVARPSSTIGLDDDDDDDDMNSVTESGTEAVCEQLDSNVMHHSTEQGLVSLD